MNFLSTSKGINLPTDIYEFDINENNNFIVSFNCIKRDVNLDNNLVPSSRIISKMCLKSFHPGRWKACMLPDNSYIIASEQVFNDVFTIFEFNKLQDDLEKKIFIEDDCISNEDFDFIFNKKLLEVERAAEFVNSSSMCVNKFYNGVNFVKFSLKSNANKIANKKELEVIKKHYKHETIWIPRIIKFNSKSYFFKTDWSSTELIVTNNFLGDINMIGLRNHNIPFPFQNQNQQKNQSKSKRLTW